MLTFDIVQGYGGLLFRDLLWLFFFQSDRPTQYQETYSTLNKKENKKRECPKWDNVWPDVLTLLKTLIWKFKFLFVYFNLIFMGVLEERC